MVLGPRCGLAPNERQSADTRCVDAINRTAAETSHPPAWAALRTGAPSSGSCPGGA